jgi:hypothetical protein
VLVRWCAGRLLPICLPVVPSSSRAALIYQHMTSDRDRAIADRLGAMIRGGRGVASGSPGEDAKRT